MWRNAWLNNVHRPRRSPAARLIEANQSFNLLNTFAHPLDFDLFRWFYRGGLQQRFRARSVVSVFFVSPTDFFSGPYKPD